MFIDASTPQYQGFDPTAQGLALPAVGVYPNLELIVASSVQGETKTKQSKMDITYEVVGGPGALAIGTQFKLTYNTGHENPDTAKWAVQDVIKIAYAITGVNYAGQRFNFDDKMYNRVFSGTFTVVNQKDGGGNDICDDQGRPYRNGRLTALKPMVGSDTHQPVQQATNIQPQQGQQPAGQPTKPKWATQ